MKQLFILLVGVLMASTLSAQTYLIEGQIINSDGKTWITVYEFDGVNEWNEVYTRPAGSHYAVALEADRDYQIWFTDKHVYTKVLAVNRDVMDVPEFKMNIDFQRNESAQISRDDCGAFVITLIDTDFTALQTPFDLYP